MRDGFTPAQLNIIKSRPQNVQWYAVVHRPATVSEMQFLESVDTHPASSLKLQSACLTPFENLSPIKAGHTLWLSANRGGSELGLLRARRDFNTTTSILDVAEAGSGLINWAKVSHVTAKDEYRPWVKHPRYDSGASKWLMDYDEPYAAQFVRPGYGPYVNIGPPVVGVLGADGKFAASFYGNRSLSWDSPIAAQLWTFPDGQTVSSLLGTCDNPVVMTFDNASKNGAYFSLKLTDSFGASHIGHRLIFVMASPSDFDRVAIGDISGGIVGGGYNAGVTAYSNAHQSRYPDGAEILIVENASYGTVGSTIGGNFPHRENIVFRGWLTAETTKISPFTTETFFNATTINGIMDKSQSYDVFHGATCDIQTDWVTMEHPCLDRVAIDLLKYRSTVGNLVDFTPASGLAITEEIAFQDLPRSPWWQQFVQNYQAKGILGYAAADLQSNIYAFADAQINGGSAGLPIAMEITRGDRRDNVMIAKTHYDNVAQVQLFAVKLDRDALSDGIREASHIPLGGESPGHPMGYYGGTRVHARGLLVDSQDTLVTWSGNMRAKLNNKYTQINVPLAGNYRLDPVPQCRVSMSLSATDNSRGIEWSNETFLPTDLTINYDSVAGAALTQVKLEKSANGIGGSSYTFPSTASYIPTTPPDPPGIPIPPVVDTGGGTGTVLVMTVDSLGRTSSFGASSPTWTDITGAVTGDLYDFILDPWNPSGVAYMTSSTGVWKTSNIKGASPSWTQLLSAANIESAVGDTGFIHPSKIVGSINHENWVGFWFVTGASWGNYKLRFGYSSDGGSTWSYAIAATTYGFPSRPMEQTWLGAADIVPHTIGGQKMLYCVVMNNGGTHTTGGNMIRKSLDGGATWSNGPSVSEMVNSTYIVESLHCPYPNNSGGQTVVVAGDDYPDGSAMRYSEDGGSTWTSAGPAKSDKYHKVKRWRSEVYTGGENNAYCWGDDNKIYVSTAGIDSTFTAKAMNGFSGTVYSSGGFPYNNSQFYAVTSTGIYFSKDGGNNWSNKTGDWAAGFASNIAVIQPQNDSMAFRPYVIVPIWTE